LSGESPDRDMIANIQAQILEMKKEILDGNLSSVLTRFADLILVSLVAVMIGLMIVPLPTFLLDIFQTINSTVEIKMNALVERLAIGSRCGADSFFTNDSICS